MMNHNTERMTGLDGAQKIAFLVEDIKVHFGRNMNGELPVAVVAAFFLYGAQDVKRRGFNRAHNTPATAMGTGLGADFMEAGAEPLARHLQQAEAADTADLDACTVGLQCFLDALFHLRAVAVLVHVYEVDDDKTGQIAQPQLTGHFVGGLEISLERGFLNISLAGRASGIDVDRDQRLGLINDDITSGFEPYRMIVYGVNLVIHLKAAEQRNVAVAIALDPLGVAGREHAHGFLGQAIAIFAVHQHLVHVARIKVADSAFDYIGLFIDQGRRRGLQGGVPDVAPKPHQIFIIALDFGLGALAPRGAYDDGDALGDGKPVEDGLELAAVGWIGDLARDSASPRHVGHQYTITSGQ